MAHVSNNRKLRLGAQYFILRNGDRISGAALVAVFATFGVASAGLERGTLMQPGPGLWPVFLAVFGAILSSMLFLVGREVPILAKAGTFKTFCVTLGSMSVLPLGYALVGFIPSAAVSLFVMIYLLGSYRWYVAAITAVCGSVAVYVLFAIGLALPIAAF